jgi:hypothetical protein
MSKSKYISKYSNDKPVSAAQYITELICEKLAKIENKDLHYRFWLNKEWSTYYKNQIASAHKLLKKYPDAAIIRALSNPKASKIYSLRAPHLVSIIEQEERKLNALLSQTPKVNSRKEDVAYRQNINISSNIISKLKDLE